MTSSFSFKNNLDVTSGRKIRTATATMSAFGLLKSYQRCKLGAIVLGQTADTNSQTRPGCGKRKEARVQ
jgi:hypothetical protein